MSYKLTEEQVETIKKAATWHGVGDKPSHYDIARAIAEPLAERIKVLEAFLATIQGFSDPNGESREITKHENILDSIHEAAIEALRGGKSEK